MGSPVWRFFQRRPGYHRPVYHQRRTKMASAERRGTASPPRSRRHGSGTFECAARTCFAVSEQLQYTEYISDKAGAICSLPATPGASQVAQSAGDLDAPEFIAAPRSSLDPERMVDGEI